MLLNYLLYKNVFQWFREETHRLHEIIILRLKPIISVKIITIATSQEIIIGRKKGRK